MSTRAERIRALIDTIAAHFQRYRDTEEGAARVLDRLATVDLRLDAFADLAPQSTRHDETLSAAIEGIEAPELTGIATALRTAKDDLFWAEDDMKYYPPGADLGEGYRRCNLHTLLIGPGACGFEAEDFTLGLFMLGPRTLYRDHAHPAPETYVNLSERTGWRFAGGEWQDMDAGSILFNPARAVHATRVYQRPFLSVFSWIENISSPCHVVPMDDWPALEAELEAL